MGGALVSGNAIRAGRLVLGAEADCVRIKGTSEIGDLECRF